MSLATNSKILIVSIYDRAFYLALELRERGFEVSVVNLPVSENLSVENWSNPFGHFHNQPLALNQKEVLAQLDCVSLPNGLSVLLPEGPIDFKSPFAKNVLRQRKVPPHLIEVESGFSHNKKENSDHWLQKLYSEIFAISNDLSLVSQKNSHPKPLFSEYSLCQSSRHSLKKQIEACQRQGISFFDCKPENWQHKENQTVQVSFPTNTKSYTFDGVVNLTSQYELAEISPVSESFFYSGQKLNPEWVWSAIDFSYEQESCGADWPEHFFVIEDLLDQWAHKNFLLVQQKKIVKELKVFFRWPFPERYNQTYFEQEVLKIKSLIEIKIPCIKLSLIRKPLTSDPCPFFVYNQSDLLNFKQKLKPLPAIYNHGPEFWPGWDWASILHSQYQFVAEQFTPEVSA